tara:strand:+ start:1038 stop:1820 length:783 start_codon:yes stop_codon:yes gene_type:complete
MSTSTIEDKYPEIVCSLTNELMINPVITNKGISYEKEAIEEWLNNKKICPITNEYLDKTLLITNYTLKNLISKLNTDNNKNNEPKEVDNQAPDYLIKISNNIFIKIIQNEFNFINIVNNVKYFTGLGEYYINNKLTYLGEIKNNQISGNGEYYRKNRIKFRGNFYMRNYNIYINGYGIEYYKNGNIKYIGDFKNSQKDGYGVYYIEPDKILYEGQYKNDKRHGHGILYYYNKIDNKITDVKLIVKSIFKNDLIWNYKNKQ